MIRVKLGANVGMSEAKRVPLQSLEFPESLGHAGKKEKKGEKGKQLEPSFRFVLILPESNEQKCPEINYSQLLRDAEKKRRKEQKRGEENSTNGLGPFDDDDDDEKLRDMAKHFEAKYGTSTVDRKRRKYDDYVDLGAGYDENDSFIDNTDAYDEIVPEEVTTAHGGFYINCGALEFKAVDRQPTLNNNNNNNNNSDEDESSESSEEDTEDVESPKRAEKRIISSSDDDDAEDITGDHPRKKQKVDENDDKKGGNQENVMKKKKKRQDQDQNSHQDPESLQRRKEKKAEIADSETAATSEEAEEKKRAEKTEGQKVKNDAEKKFDIKKFEKKASNSNGFDAKKLDVKKLGGKDRSIDDAIESVVNAARVEDESSRDTTDSAKSRCLGTESECDDIEKEEAPMPDSLSEEDKQIVNQLKAHAENSKEGKGKFFNSAVNTLLCSLEKKLRSRYTPSDRLQTYGHLARFLPCSKIALQNRAKKLHLQEVEYKVKEPMQRLKAIIENVMPSVMVKYVKDCKEAADEKGPEVTPADDDSTEDEDANKNSEKSKIPKRKFPWTKETKKLVYEIANARRQYFEVLRPRKETMENYVNRFMETEVLPLWPPGYVDLHILLKYSNPSRPVIVIELE